MRKSAFLPFHKTKLVKALLMIINKFLLPPCQLWADNEYVYNLYCTFENFNLNRNAHLYQFCRAFSLRSLFVVVKQLTFLLGFRSLIQGFSSLSDDS